jgi:Flp pilus assembly protein TadB
VALSQQTEPREFFAHWALLISILSMTISFILLVVLLLLMRRSARREKFRELALQLPGKDADEGHEV